MTWSVNVLLYNFGGSWNSLILLLHCFALQKILLAVHNTFANALIFLPPVLLLFFYKVPFLSCWDYCSMFLTEAPFIFPWPTPVCFPNAHRQFSDTNLIMPHTCLKCLKASLCPSVSYKVLWDGAPACTPSCPVSHSPVFLCVSYTFLTLVPHTIRCLSIIDFAVFPHWNVPQPFNWLSPTHLFFPSNFIVVQVQLFAFPPHPSLTLSLPHLPSISIPPFFLSPTHLSDLILNLFQNSHPAPSVLDLALCINSPIIWTHAL